MSSIDQCLCNCLRVTQTVLTWSAAPAGTPLPAAGILPIWPTRCPAPQLLLRPLACWAAAVAVRVAHQLVHSASRAAKHRLGPMPAAVSAGTLPGRQTHDSLASGSGAKLDRCASRSTSAALSGCSPRWLLMQHGTPSASYFWTNSSPATSPAWQNNSAYPMLHQPTHSACVPRWRGRF